MDLGGRPVALASNIPNVRPDEVSLAEAQASDPTSASPALALKELPRRGRAFRVGDAWGRACRG